MIRQVNKDSARAVEYVRKKMKTDKAGDGAAGFVVDLFNCSTPMMVDEVKSGTEVSYDLLCFWHCKSNVWPRLTSKYVIEAYFCLGWGHPLQASHST